jgi:hypothetical protein
MNNSCLFCARDGAGILSNEHVIPRWLLDHLDLPESDQLFQGVSSSKTNELITSPRIHSSFNFVQGHVCRECNNGWMSRLEALARPILVPLIDGESKIENLSPTESAIIAKWTTKTAYMHSLTSPLKQPVISDHVRGLKGDDGVPSSEVAVFGMLSDFKKQNGYFLARQWPYFGRRGGIPIEVAQASYKIGLQFRHLYFLVAYWPEPALFAMATGLHIPIFPRSRPWRKYSGEFVVGDGPVDQLAVFCRSLGLFFED